MEKVRRRVSAILVLLLAALVAFSPMARAAGSLEPNAPPGPVMKSLDEVEPRILIKASNLPLVITQRGSYYLTQDVSFTDTAHNAITVNCDNVTIDLEGYTITGPNSTGYSGIYMDGRTNVEVRNGTVRDFYNGIYESSGIGKGHRVINIRAVSNTSVGINLLSYGNLVKDCTATENGSIGIYARIGSTVTGNTATYNPGHGISVFDGSTVTGNTASFNGINGIYAEWGCTVTGNTAYGNTGDGIYVTANSNITDNTCYNNGYGSNSAGIHVGGSYCRIEENHVVSNYRGIDVDSSPNLIVKNSAAGNIVEYDIVAGNKTGMISSDPNTAGPWANFDF